MPSHIRRQAPGLGGAVTVAASSGVDSTLAFDPDHSGVNTAIAPPTITVSVTSTSTSETSSATESAPAASSNASSSTISTGAIIGITIGIFACLAIALIVWMSTRNRKRVAARRARANSASKAKDRDRKSWARMKDKDEPLPMHATAHAQHASIADSHTRPGDESFLSLNSTHALIVKHQAHGQDQDPAQAPEHSRNPFTQPAPPSRNPFLGQPSPPPQLSPVSPATPLSAPAPPSRSTDDTHIPNPFASPSHSPSPSQESAYSSPHAHAPSLDAGAMLTVAQPRTPQHTEAHDSVLTASSVSDYPYEFPAPPGIGTSDASRTDFHLRDEPKPSASSTKLARQPSAKEAAQESRARELKAMQDLISALDQQAQQKQAHAKPPPSAFNLKVDTEASNAARGVSRLSMGEGLVTPGGHSIREDENGVAYDENGDAYWAHGGSVHGHDAVPLPTADEFRAALDMAEHNQADKAKGKGKAPFWEE